MRKRVVELVENLIGKGVVVKSLVTVDKKPAEVVEKDQKKFCFNVWWNDKWGWYENGDDDKDYKYVGEIKNGKPNVQLTITYTDGTTYVGEFNNGVNIRSRNPHFP